MGMLSKITTGKIRKPIFGTIYGVPGVGKTTWVSEAPKPLIIGSEEGSNEMDVARLKVGRFDELTDTIKELITDKHDYQTLGLDSLDHIEMVIWQAVCDLDGAKSIAQAQGGYGKGYDLALKYWNNLIETLLELREKRKMNIIGIAHAQVKPYNDPRLPNPYDRYDMKLYKTASALWCEKSDLVLFAAYETFSKANDKTGVVRGYGGKKRFLHTTGDAAYEAKTRFPLPEMLPLSYQDFELALNNPSPDETRKEIDTLLESVTDDTLKKVVLDTANKAGRDVVQLAKILNKLRIRIGA